VDPIGNIYVADKQHHRVRKMSAVTGLITSVAGNGILGGDGDNGLATAASLSFPAAIALDVFWKGREMPCRNRTGSCKLPTSPGHSEAASLGIAADDGNCRPSGVVLRSRNSRLS
jgi:hypothetical protein